MPTGRPSKYSPALSARICEAIADGKSLRAVSILGWAPSERTLYNWLSDEPEFLQQYERAREQRTDQMAAEILEISDDSSKDTIEITNDDGDVVGEKCDHEWVNRSRLRVDARKWLMARMTPRKWGDKLSTELTGKDGGPMEVVVRWGKKPDETKKP